MVLHSESEGIVTQSYLLDDVIGCAPRFHFETGAQFIDCLMMRAIHFFKTMARFAIGSERLDVACLLIRQVMASDVEMKGAAERDVESLQSFADRKNRKPAFDRVLDCVEFPAIPVGIHVLFDYGWIGNRLIQELGSNIGPVSNNPSICSKGTLRRAPCQILISGERDTKGAKYF